MIDDTKNCHDSLISVENGEDERACAEIARLARLSAEEYETRRKDAARRLNWRVAVLDREVEQARPTPVSQDKNEGEVVEEVKPWPQRVDATSLADEISTELSAHVVFRRPEQAYAVTLWILGTYFMEVWALWPKLLISSPEKRCGKTVLAETIEAHVHRPFLVSNISAAGLFRIIEEYHPTLIIDEADRFLRRNEEANGIINAGHRRRSAVVVRVEERNGEHRPRKFSVWGAQVIAGIGTQEDTLVDRSVRVALRRRLQSERIAKLPAQYFEDRLRARRQLVRWASETKEKIRECADEAPPCRNDRAQDNWTPLFRIASALGGEWPKRCNAAYLAIELDNEDQAETLGARLLRDIAGILAPYAGRLGSQALCEKLTAIEDAPWSELPPKGLPISTQRIAAILKDYEVRPRQDKLGSYYDAGDILRALERYAPQHVEDSATSCHTAIGRTNATEKVKEIKHQWHDGTVAVCDGSSGEHIAGRSGEPEILNNHLSGRFSLRPP